MTELAPAKVNLCLFLGPTRADGRHELVTVMQPLAFGDTVEVQAAERDEVVCPGVTGPNLAEAALHALRARAGGTPLRLTIHKRIPVAAGLAGGSADAGAALRLAAAAAGFGDEDALLDIAARLGADVPAQLRPRRVLASGAGEQLEEVGPGPDFGVLVLPSRERLSTPDVYAEADRLALPRDAAALADRRAMVRQGLGRGAFGMPTELLVNDLEPAARALCPSIGSALDAVRSAGADVAMVSGSGPTVLGLFAEAGDAVRAAAELRGRSPEPIATMPLRATR